MQENVNVERAHCFALSESSLGFDVVYWILTCDYLVYMNAQQAIDLALRRCPPLAVLALRRVGRLASHPAMFAKISH